MPDINGTNPQNIMLKRGDTLALYVYRLGDLSLIDDIWFTVKKRLSDEDNAAQIQVSQDTGLLAIAGAVATTPANGSVTITDAAVGNVTITITAEEMAKLSGGYVGYWDIQTLSGVVVVTEVYGNVRIIGDVTRGIV